MTQKDLKQLYSEHSSKVSDKWSLYLDEYDRIFAPFRDRPVHLLEIGIQNGGSLEIWSKFFDQSKSIVGCDINPDCQKLRYEEPHIQVIVGDANTDTVEQKILSVSSEFEIVIDDGSHRSSDIVRTFVRYFPHISEGGMFVAEDLHCSYWENYEGGLFHPFSSVAFFKRLADVISHEHWGNHHSRRDVLRGFFAEYACEMNEQLLAEVHSIEFINSICIVRKKTAAKNQLGHRIITNGTAEVCSIVQSMNNSSMAAPEQTGNIWSHLDSMPEELLSRQKMDIEALRIELENRKLASAERDERLATLTETLQQMTNSKSWRYTLPLRWALQQSRRLREQGLAARLRALARKTFRYFIIKGIGFVKARPTLQNQLQSVASRLGVAQSLRNLSRKIQSRPDDGAAELRLSVVSSYPVWSARFDTPSTEVMKRLAQTGSELDPVHVIAKFDAASAGLAPELAKRLLGSVGQPWSAVFLFSPELDGRQMAESVQKVAQGDPRISFDASVRLGTTGILVLVEGGALPRPHALRTFSDALRMTPDALLAYADEDRWVEGSAPADPWFKPRFSPLLARQGLLLGRMLALRNSSEGVCNELSIYTADAASICRQLALQAGDSRVLHIPHVLFHDALPPAPTIPLSLTLPDRLPTVSIIIPTRDRWDLLGPCLESLYRTNWPGEKLNISVVDNGSTDPKTLRMLAKASEDGRIQLIRDDRQFNWSRLNNVAARSNRSELLVFLNNDTEVNDLDWLKKLAVHALEPNTGAVGCKLLYEDRTVQHGGVIAGIQGVAGHAHLFLKPDAGGYRNLATTTHEVSAVTGACLAVTRGNFEAVGGFDENFRVAFNDTAFCFALHELGKRNLYVADPLFIHYESKSRGYDDTPEKKALNQAEARKAWERFAGLMRNDPFYSPNLSLWAPYELAFAPRRKPAWDTHASRPLRVMILSVTHAIGHGVPVVLSMHAAALVRKGYEVLVAGPRTANDFPYPGCHRIEVYDALSAATLAAIHGADVVIAHTPPFYSVARWTGAYPAVIAYDHGEPPPEWFPDATDRQSTLAEKDQSLMMATAVYAISKAIANESRTPVNGVIPLGNEHLGRWSEALTHRRKAVRGRRGWQGKFVVLNVCRFHSGERRYKGVDVYAKVGLAAKQRAVSGSTEIVFVLCGKGTPADVDAMEALGLTVAANVTDEEMMDLYCAADAYANFSQWEGYNLGIGQALAMGLPTIASDIPAHRAFGIEVTNDVTRAADWVHQTLLNSPARVPKVWSWEEPCQRLVEVIEATVGCKTAVLATPAQKIQT